MGYKVLGQVNPTAGVSTLLYACPSGLTTVVSTLVICNLAATATTYRVWIQVNAASPADKQFIMYDFALGAPGGDFYTIGLTLAQNDQLVVATPGNVAFSCFGEEA